MISAVTLYAHLTHKIPSDYLHQLTIKKNTLSKVENFILNEDKSQAEWGDMILIFV